MFWCSPDPQSGLTDEGGFLLAFTIREELLEFEIDYSRWLQTPVGRFEQYYAERERLAARSL